jgi:hypothetical protein
MDYYKKLLNSIVLFLDMDRWVIFCDKNALSEDQVARIDREVSPSWYQLDQFTDWLGSGEPTAIGCHNIAGFDLPSMKKLGIIDSYDVFPDHINNHKISLYDTLDMSYTLHPDRPFPYGCPTSIFNPVTKKMDKIGSHGLMAWGYRVGNLKPVIHDWRNQPLETYLQRCIDDVKINVRTWKYLIEEAKAKALNSDGWADALRLS